MAAHSPPGFSRQVAEYSPASGAESTARATSVSPAATDSVPAGALAGRLNGAPGGPTYASRRASTTGKVTVPWGRSPGSTAPKSTTSGSAQRAASKWPVSASDASTAPFAEVTRTAPSCCATGAKVIGTESCAPGERVVLLRPVRENASPSSCGSPIVTS